MFYLTEGIQEGTFTVFFLFFNNGGTFPPPRVHEVLLHCYFCPFSRPTRKAVTLQKTWLGWSDGPEAPLIRMFQEGQQHGDVRSCDQTHTRQEKKMLNIHTERHQMADQQSSLCLFITSPMTLFQLRLETVHEQIFYFPANTWCPTPDPHKHMITLLTSTEHCLTVLCISYIIQTKMHKRKVLLVVFYWCILWTVSLERDTARSNTKKEIFPQKKVDCGDYKWGSEHAQVFTQTVVCLMHMYVCEPSLQCCSQQSVRWGSSP